MTEDVEATPSQSGGMAQTDPDAATRFVNAETRQTLHEMQGALGGLLETARRIEKRQDEDKNRLARLDAFLEYGVPHLATKSDIKDLEKEISHRPTRRQAIEDIFKFGGLIGVVVALFGYFTRAH